MTNTFFHFTDLDLEKSLFLIYKETKWKHKKTSKNIKIFYANHVTSFVARKETTKDTPQPKSTNGNKWKHILHQKTSNQLSKRVYVEKSINAKWHVEAPVEM